MKRKPKRRRVSSAQASGSTRITLHPRESRPGAPPLLIIDVRMIGAIEDLFGFGSVDGPGKAIIRGFHGECWVVCETVEEIRAAIAKAEEPGL